MDTCSNFQTIRRKCLNLTEKIVRYNHHVIFISTNLKYGGTPKGFKLKFHNNMPNLNVQSTIEKCSKKIMVKTLQNFKKQISQNKILLTEIFNNNVLTSNESTQIIQEIDKRKNKLSAIFEKRRKSKYKRDNIKCKELSNQLQLFNDGNFEVNSTTEVSVTSKKNELIGSTEIPSYEPLCLGKTQVESQLSSICSKGPSFVPTPSSFNWLQVLKDFDTFKHKIRSKAYFHTRNCNTTTNDSHKDVALIFPPYQQKNIESVAPKSKYPEVETFLSKIEQDIFANTLRKNIKPNLTTEERIALNNWRKEMNNPNNDTILRIQDKGNRFILVDKETDKQKAMAQIERSNFEAIDHDPTNHHIEIVNHFVDKWKSIGELDNTWASYILNENARPGKNSTLYKTHKKDIPVRLLTTGCNTAIEKLAIFVEKHCSPLAEKIPTRSRDSYHLLDIIDELNTEGIPENVKLVTFDIKRSQKKERFKHHQQIAS